MFFHELSVMNTFSVLCVDLLRRIDFLHDSHFREDREGHMEYQLTKPRENSRKRTQSVRAAGCEANVFFVRVCAPLPL